MRGPDEHQNFISFLRYDPGRIVKFIQCVDVSYFRRKFGMAVSVVGSDAEFLVLIPSGFQLPRYYLEKLRQCLEIRQRALGIQGGTGRVLEYFQQLPVEAGFRFLVKTYFPHGE